MTAQPTESAPAPSVLRLQEVHAGYGDLMVLHGVDLSIRNGERMAVLGPNGAGKTTLMRTIAGVLPVASGTIQFGDEDVTAMNSHRRLQHIGWVPEGRLLFADYSVHDNLALSARAAGQTHHFEESLQECLDLFPVLGNKLSARAGTLSGGQQQMAAVARALVRRPQVLMLDEPSVGLAPRVVHDIRDALDRLSSQGLTILVTEQNVGWLTGLVDSVVVMRHGQITMHGTHELLADREALRSIYLGK